MIDRRSKMLLVLLYLLICATTAAARLLHLPNTSDFHTYVVLLGGPVTIGIAMAILHLYATKNGLHPEYQHFVGKCLVVMMAIMLVTTLYRQIYLPVSGMPLDKDGYNRVLVTIGGIIFVGFGNLLPRLPYQKMQNWLEIGPARTYRLNRLCGWLMVVVGIAMMLAGLTATKMPGTQVDLIVTLALMTVFIPYTLLHIRYAIAWRQQNELV